MAGGEGASGAFEFWLTRMKPGWQSDDARHMWPEFRFGDVIVNVWKEPAPCRLLFNFHGLHPTPVDVTCPCPDVIPSPYRIPGVHVRVQWHAGRISLSLNAQPVADLTIDA